MKRAGSERAARARLDQIAREHSLDRAAVERLWQVLEATASDPHAPTTVTDPAAIVDVHFADSLSALPLLDELGPECLADVGSGAGYPGIPLAIARPEMDVDLVESAARACAFLERVVAGIALPRLRVVHARVEEWGRDEGRGRYDLAAMRALAPMPVLLEYAAPLLRDGGALIAWKGRGEPPGPAAAAAAALGLEAERVIPTRPYARSRNRQLHLYRRVRPVPDAYPRRPGMARKRPLGRSAGPR